MEVVERKNPILGIATENFDKALSLPRNTRDVHFGPFWYYFEVIASTQCLRRSPSVIVMQKVG